MNLFVAATGERAADLASSIEAAVLTAGQPFPVLTRGEARIYRSVGDAVLVTLGPADSVAAPRVYTTSSPHNVLTFDGLPLSRAGAPAWDARELANRFDSLADELEGAFAVVRLHMVEPLIEVLTDPLGNLPVYRTALADGTQLVGNSLAALAQVAGASELDTAGVATFLTLGWFAERRTPLLRISVLPGGSRIRIARGQPIAIDRHFGPQWLVQGSSPSLAQVKDELENLVRSACVPDGIDLALTGGRDSRVCLGLALETGVDFKTYTEGPRGMCDVEAAREVSERFHVPHAILEPPGIDEVDVGALIHSFVAQGDCTSGFVQLVDQLPQLENPRRLAVKVMGLGGEVARTNTHRVRAFLASGPPLADLAAVQRQLTLKKIALFDGLVTGDCRVAAEGYVDRWFSARRDEGFPGRWLAESMYVFDAMIRAHNGSVRRAAATADLVAPLSSRVFLRAAWSRSPADRYGDVMHKSLLELLDPRLLQPPLISPFSARRTRFTWARTTSGLIAQAARARKPRGMAQAMGHPLWAAQRELHLELVGSLDDSTLFSFVDRGLLLRALESHAVPSSGVMRALSLLWWLHRR